MTTHANRLREIAERFHRHGYHDSPNQLREIATALEAAPDTAALEAKVAEWEKLGAECVETLETIILKPSEGWTATDAKMAASLARKQLPRLTAMLAKPDPLVEAVEESLRAIHHLSPATLAPSIAAELRKRGIGEGSAK